MINYKEEKVERMGAFLYGAMRMGYCLADAWDLMLKSEQGQGLLRGEYMYAEHLQGMAVAQKAEEAIGENYPERKVRTVNLEQMYLLAEFIEYAHDSFDMPYSDIFSKCDIETFMRICGDFLGNYDDKLIKRYLL